MKPCLDVEIIISIPRDVITQDLPDSQVAEMTLEEIRNEWQDGNIVVNLLRFSNGVIIDDGFWRDG